MNYESKAWDEASRRLGLWTFEFCWSQAWKFPMRPWKFGNWNQKSIFTQISAKNPTYQIKISERIACCIIAWSSPKPVPASKVGTQCDMVLHNRCCLEYAESHAVLLLSSTNDLCGGLWTSRHELICWLSVPNSTLLSEREHQERIIISLNIRELLEIVSRHDAREDIKEKIIKLMIKQYPLPAPKQGQDRYLSRQLFSTRSIPNQTN